MDLVFIWHEVSNLWYNVVVCMMSWKYQMTAFHISHTYLGKSSNDLINTTLIMQIKRKFQFSARNSILRIYGWI